MKKTLALGLVCLLAACGPSRVERATPIIESDAGRTCTDNAGKLIIRQTSGSQKAYCQLPDGRRLDMWEFYRQMNP